MGASIHHQVVIIGGGTAGITVAARLRRASVDDIAVIEPSETHYYQPLFTLVGGGCASIDATRRPESTVMPKGVAWIKDAATAVDPDEQAVTTEAGARVTYDYLVVCPGIQLDWDAIPGMREALATPYASSNYDAELAPKTWEMIQRLRSGTAVFTMPAGPIKCAGAPQKIAYLAADYWREQGVLDDIRMVLVLPTPGMFGVKEFADQLRQVADDYGIEVHTSSVVTSIDAGERSVVVHDNESGDDESVSYDLLHAVPPQSAPDWIKSSPLADPDNPAGYVQIDKNSMQHTRYPNVFSLGDAGSSPNSKTGAAVRSQAPVVVDNLLAAMRGGAGDASYGGYASCPLTTSRHHMLLAEFDYSMTPTPTFKGINTIKPRRDMWYLKKYGLPLMYWNFMLKGRA